MSAGADPAWRLTRSAVLRDAAGVSIATGAYAISFGAISLAGGLDLWQTMALSLLMFTGGSQFGLIGVVGAAWLSDPRALGLDAAAPAAFLALLAPRLRGREAWAIALVGAVVAVIAVPIVPVGFPVLIAALVGIVAGFLPGRTGPDGPTGVDEVVQDIDGPSGDAH
ncbi:MAG TPA: AzlC family ABC transporter permease [Nakamurella sp.]